MSTQELTAEQESFMKCSVRTTFQLALSQTMLEFLCAVADDVRWDRSRFVSIHRPDNWIATEAALTKRGLIRRKLRAVMKEETDAYFRGVNQAAEGVETKDAVARNFCELTEIGKAAVALLKAGGLFVKADDATLRESIGS